MALPGLLLNFGLKHAFDLASKEAADWLDGRFDDRSRDVLRAVFEANRRAWAVVGAALVERTFWERVKGLVAEADFKAARDAARGLLANLPPDTRQKAAAELEALSERLRDQSPESAADAAALRRFASPSDVLADADRAAADLPDALADAPNLKSALQFRPDGRIGLFHTFYRYYIRKCVQGNAALSAQLTADQLRAVGEQLDARTAGILDQFDALFDHLDAKFAEVNAKLVRMEAKLDKLLDERGVSTNVRDPLRVSVTNAAELAFLRELRDELRDLPPELIPSALRVKLGDALAAARLLAEAREQHEAAAREARDRAVRAEAEFKAYRDACEQEAWSDALPALLRAADLDAPRFAPFPLRRYEPLRIVGAGGFGTVVHCRDRLGKGREVAVKAFHAADLGRDLDEVFAEAHTLAGLGGPGIVKVLHWDFTDVEQSRPYLVMEFFDGPSLDVLLKREGRLPVADVVSVARSVAGAMAAAHAANVLHRDLKPGNILVRRRAGGGWDVCVIDFGLAVRFAAVQASVSTAAPHRTRRDVSFAGSLEYASPEQKGAIAAPVGPRSDVYSFGKTMLEALLGTTEPVSEDWEAVPDPFRDPLRKVFEKCVVRDPGRRHDSFGLIVRALAELDRSGPVEAALPLAEPVVEPPPPAVPPKESAVERLRRLKRQAGEKNARARALFDRHDYAGAAALLNGFAPEEVPDRDDALLAEAVTRRIRLAALDAEIQALVDRNLVKKPELPGLLAASLELNPTNAEWRELADELRREREEAERLEATRREAERVRAEQEAARRRKAEEEAIARDPWHPQRDRKAGQPVKLKLPGDVPLTLSWCPPGEFRMGSEKGASDEKPVHTVTISKGFFMGIHPVTQAQWKAVMGTDPSHFKGPNRPVEQVSWDDAQEFCGKLQALVRKNGAGAVTVRLPTEAEWEYACRAGTTTEYHFGDVITTDLANYDGNCTWNGSPEGTHRQQTTDVGTFSANPWGLYDVHGNVWEWCQDAKRTYNSSPQVDPQEKSNDNWRVLRGGSWGVSPGSCRAAFRGWNAPARRCNFVCGFRVCFRLD